MLWSSWNIGASQSGFKLELLFIRFLPLWFGKKLEYSLSGVLSISGKQGLKRKFQVGVLESHPINRVWELFKNFRLDTGASGFNIIN